LAHELGHLLAGHAGEEICFDRELSDSSEAERAANAFAASYLLPEEAIRTLLEEMGRRLSTLVYLTDEFGVSFETLIYRLHNLRIINAHARNRLLEMRWQQLVSQSMPELASTMSQERRGRLLVRSQQRPSGRPPSLLLRRANDGYRKGILSVRPLAGLLKEDPAKLLERLTDSTNLADESAFFGDLESSVGSEDENPEDLFSGIPV
jgi:hypothetical protein